MCTKKKELQLSYFSICEGKKLDDKIVTYFALKAESTVYTRKMVPITGGASSSFSSMLKLGLTAKKRL